MAGSDTEATVMLNVVPGMNTGITAFNAGLSSINAQFQNVTDTIGSTFGLMDAMIVSTSAMLVQFGMGAANAFGEFEQGMRIVKAVSQQSGQSIAYLQQQAQDFAIQYRTGIDSITEGLQTLGRAGLNSAQEQTEVLEQGLQTAKLEGRELNGVLEEIIQNTSLLGGDVRSDQFGEQAEYLNNLLVGTSLSAPLDTHDISETLKYSGGMVAAAGGTIATDEGYANEAGREIVEDYMGAVAAFAQKGVKGSIAGTALRAFFNKPAAQDKSVVDALNSIGLAPEDLWDNEETMKPVSEQIELIQTQMTAHNVSKMDQMQLWSKIVGGKMGQQMMKLNAQDIREMTTDIQGASSARDLSEQTFNTYNQKMNKLNEESQKLFRDFGEHIVTAIRPALEVLDKLAEILNNPIFSGGVTFAGFITFLAIVSHSLRAVLRIAQRLKQELSWVFGGNSAVGQGIPSYNLPKSKYAGMQINNISEPKDKASVYIRRPSDSIDRVSAQNTFQSHIDQKKKAKQEYFNTVKSNISGIQQQMSEMIESINTQFDNLDINVDINLDDIQTEIKQIGTTAKTTIREIESQAKITLDSVRAQLASMKESDVIGTGLGLKAHPVAINNRAITEIMAKLPKEARDLINKQLRDGTLDIGNLFSSGTTGFEDPFYRDRNRNLDPTDGRQSYFRYENRDLTRNENGRIVVDDKEFDKFSNASMVPHQITQEELDIARQYMGMPNMDDFVKFQIMMQQMFPNLPHQWVMDEKTGGYTNLREGEWDKSYQAKVAADEKEMYDKAKAVLDELFKGAKNAAKLAAENEKAELMGVWGGLSEEEFNNQYYKNRLGEQGFVQVNGWTQDTPHGSMPYLLPLNEPSGKNLSGIEKMWDDINDVVGKDIEGREALAELFEYEKPDEIPRTYADYERMERERREKQGREKIGFSSAIPGVITQDAFDFNAKHRDEDYSGYKKIVEDSYVTPSRGWRGKLSSGRKELSKSVDKAKDKLDGFAKSLGSTKTSTIGKAVDILGGPFSVAIMGATAAMEAYNYMFGQWQKSVQEHQQEISEAENSVSEAESNIRKAYQEQNPNATQAEADQAVNDAYIAIAENGYKMSGLDANTQALYVATSQLQRATEALESDAEDGKFGRTGLFTDISDLTAQLSNQMPFIGNWGTQVVQDTGEMGTALSKQGSLYGYNTQAGSILDNQNKAVLTGSQSSDDYLYSKENAAIFADDVYKAFKDRKKDPILGLDNFFGTDANHFQEVTKSIFKGKDAYGGSSYDVMAKMVAENFGDSNSQFNLQMGLKRYKKEFQQLGKQMRKYEKRYGGQTALSEFTKKGATSSKALKNLEVKDKDLYRYIRSLSIKTGLSEQKVLMAAQLQQMQDLNQIMTEQLQPQVLGIASNAYQQLSAQLNGNQQAGSAASGANSTAASAAAIAAKLSVLVEQALDKEMVQDYIARGGTDEEIIKDDSGQVLKSRAVAAWNKDESERTPWENFLVEHYLQNSLRSEYLSGWDLVHPNATEEERNAAMNNYWNKVSRYDTFQDAIAATRTGANAYYKDALLSAYDASSLGEGDSEPSGGSGGSGDDGKDKDKDSGTKKERVDLVLCNKKEIPKLNVNLFKKAPQFTVLNKNFKLRDIRINTQDKPKAVLASLKNAIIDTQKRMDPKIIQDEEAEYDPVAATDGNSTPSGSTSTTTDD